MIKQNHIFGLMSKIAASIVLFVLVLISSCKDDENPVAVATVQFSTAQQSVSESGSSITVLLNFDKAAGRDGTITVTATEGAETDYTTHYLTNPNGSSGTLELEVSKGQTSTQFTFTPVNNALLQEDKTVTFTIADVSSGFEIGATDSDLITINDDEGPTRANFAVASSSTAENLTDGIDVTINLTSPAPGTGSVVVAFESANATYTTNFITEPAVASGLLEVPVAVGETTVHFKVKPVDDGSVNATRTINFTFEEATGAVELGTTITSHTLSITDNETPSVAAFDGTTASTSEDNATGITVPVTLTPATNGTGTAVISFTGGTYGEDFTTDPAAVSGKITLNIATSTGSSSFKVIPVNDTEVTANRELTFTLTESTGVVTLGTTGTSYEVTIEEDDAIATIADVRAAFPGTTTNITSSLRIRGVVTSSNPQVNTNNIWVQDNTGGIVVRLAAANNNTVERGDDVTIQLNGGQYFEFSGLLQIQNVPNANVVVNSKGAALPTPEVITVAQLNSNAFEGKLVSISDVAFVDANGTATMSGTRAVSNGTTTTNVRTETTAPHAASVMPYGFGTITGLAGENSGAAQIIPIVFANDVFTNNPSGTIGITGALADFGSVNTGAESADQSYVVQGTSLIGDIIVTASAGFKVSLTQGGTYESSVTIPAASANLATTVYVKFIPANGGAQNGTIAHKSLGAASVVVNVSGTGVGASPLQTLALWTFETSLPNSTGAVSANLQAESGTLAVASIASGVHLSASTVYSNPAGNGSAESFSSNFWDTNDYYQFATNSTGMADLKISWDQTRSGSGPSAFALYYSTDGTNFTKHADYTVIQATWASGAAITTTSFSYDLSSVTALNNQSTLVFRLVHTGSGIATGGTNRVDNVKVEAR
ncbi:MAG: hypothetical protein JNK18_01815 [Cyclobacteriaceae bacterium]|nr:hypothetical protein [Cyclobacteriaceae bacterium]